eukprot:scaffold1341_cov178-Amphora_coffeaeformis.AAC.12
MSLEVDFVKSVKDAFGDSSEDTARRAAFQAIFHYLNRPHQENTSYEAVLELLEDNVATLPLFVRIEQFGQLLLHAALANGASLEVIRLLVEADETRRTLLRPSTTREHMIPLHQALSQKQVSRDVIEFLMHADPSRKSWVTRHEARTSGRYPLHWAAAQGLTDICRQLMMDENVDVAFAPDNLKRLPLHYAAASGVPATVQVCIANSLDLLLAQEEQGALPLHWAGSVSAMEALMLADVEKLSWNSRSHSNLTPLHKLVLLPMEDNLSLDLMEKLIEVDESMLEEIEQNMGFAPLHLALQKPCPEMIRALVSLSPFHILVLRCTKWGNLPIHYAVTKGLEIARIIVEADHTLLDARNTEPGKTPLAYLVSQPDADVATVKYLLDLDPSVASIPDDFGSSPLHAAILACGNEEIVQMLLEADPSTVYSKEYQGALPMHIAARTGTSLDVLEMLLANDPSRKTLLMPARDGCLPIHEVLKDSFVYENLLKRDYDGETVEAENAMTTGGPSEKIIDFFLRGDPERISMMASDSSGRTPLHYAARLRESKPGVGLACARALVEAKPEAVLLADQDGNLPLHLAANMKQPNPDMLQILVAADPTRASLLAKNKDAHIPLALARERDTPESALKLLRVGTGPFIEDQTEPIQQLWRNVRNLLQQNTTTVPLLDGTVSRDDLKRLTTFRDHFGLSLLHVAAGQSNVEILRVILQSNPSMLLTPEDTHGELPIHAAAISPNGTSAMLEFLMNADETKTSLCTPDFHGRLALHNVMRYGADPAKATVLLNGDSSLNSLYTTDATGSLAIHYHCGPIAEEAVSILVGQDPTKDILRVSTHKDRELPIHVHAREPKVARVLLEADQPNKTTLLTANASGDLPLHAIVSSFQMTPDIVEFYARLAPSAFGVTGDRAELPLHRATRFIAPLPVVEAVLNAAPEYISSQDGSGNLPVHLAAIREARKFNSDGPTALLDFIIAQYPEGVKVPNADGQYPIHAAADSNITASTLPVLERLWQAGSPLTDTKGEHLAHYIARHSNQIRSPERFLSPILKSLLRVDPNSLHAKNGFGLTAQQLLQEYTTDEALLNLFQPIHVGKVD